MTPKIPNAFTPLFAIYDQMDRQWNTIATSYEFQCTGCKDNCCRSLFFHHTYIEKNYFLYGFSRLDPDNKTKILTKAKQYIHETFSSDKGLESKKIMCPANKDGRCALYRYRPMICRLHGLPHQICRPGFEPVKGPGCDAGNFDKKDSPPLDRTPFYRQMAQAEMTYRSRINKTGKLKETIAHMLLSPEN